MDLSEVSINKTKSNIELNDKTVAINRFVFRINKHITIKDSSNRTFCITNLSNMIEENLYDKEEIEFCNTNDFFFYGSGYQSWGFGGETEPGKYEKKYIPLVPQFRKYIYMPGNASNYEKKLHGKKLTGQFIIYFRWNNIYLVVASTGNSQTSLARKIFNYEFVPPVEFSINRKKRFLCCSVNAVGKKWSLNDVVAETSVFAVHSFFELKAVLNKLYSSENESRFSHYKKLSLFKNKFFASGWESWYNHYSNINEKLIQEDLQSLGKANNIIKTFALPKTKNVIFQVDDGWEKAAGFWDCNKERFPSGMRNLSESISKNGYVPGLWVAPFITDYRSEFCKNHIDWILHNKKGKIVEAGFNPLWGDFVGKNQPCTAYSFFCLDLSIPEVRQYLDILMDHIINGWGFRYLKLDFLYAGMLEGEHKNGGAAYEWYERTIAILTSRKKNDKGEDVFYLGCGMPFELSFNHFPLSRIGPDTKEDWDVPLMKALNFSGRTSAHKNLQSTLGHAFWNESVYINDPDVVFLRNNNINLNGNEKELIAMVNFLFGGQLMHSDDPTLFDEKTEGALTKKITTMYEKFSKEEFGLQNITSETYFIFSKSAKYYGAINLSNKRISVYKAGMSEKLFVEKHSIRIVEKSK